MAFSKDGLPQFLAAVDIDLPQRDFFRIAEIMEPSEIPHDVSNMLDAIAIAIGIEAES
jgi:hypothetical protein